jgi:hypothetical protein
MAEIRRQGRSLLVGLVMIGIGVFVGYVWPRNEVTPSSETGTAQVVASQPAAASGSMARFQVRFTPSKSKGKRETYWLVAGFTRWQPLNAVSWTSATRPSCLKYTSPAPVKVTIGAMTVNFGNSQGSEHVIAWLKCGS